MDYSNFFTIFYLYSYIKITLAKYFYNLTRVTFYYNLLIIYIFFKDIAKIFIVISFSYLIHPIKIKFSNFL